jgi:class 3 adenylate cyclase
VFTLLETIYGAMDTAARKLGAFKVETVGETYVAATGLPEQREDHALVMARFARTCLLRVKELTRALESSLGPGTADLEMRFGMHSGPVTAGVLRGEKSRFQLFGDTMNTGKIQQS